MTQDADDSILQHDLKVAYNIQQSFLPRALPKMPGTDLAAFMRPARDVGGDFYDAIPLSGGRMGMLIADVSGKGIPAALYMALARTLLRTHSLSAQPRFLTDALENPQVRRLMRSGSLGALAALDAVRQTNEYLLAHHSEPVMFLTLFYAVYDPNSRLFTYVNAGHNPPLVHNAISGQQDWLSPTDMAIGLMKGRIFEARERQLEPGDVVVMYTDGVTEAFDPQRRLFDEVRLSEAAASLAELPAEAVLNGIVDKVESHAAGTPQSDDLTMFILKVSAA